MAAPSSLVECERTVRANAGSNGIGSLLADSRRTAPGRCAAHLRHPGEQLRDLGSQHEAAQRRAERAKGGLDTLLPRVMDRELAITREREAQVLHVRAIQDNAHADVDRARQESP